MNSRRCVYCGRRNGHYWLCVKAHIARVVEEDRTVQLSSKETHDQSER